MACLRQGKTQEERKGCRSVYAAEREIVSTITDPCWTTACGGEGKEV